MRAQLSVSVRPDCVATVLHTSRINLLLLTEKEQINMAVPRAQIINSDRTKNYAKPADENNCTLSMFLGQTVSSLRSPFIMSNHRSSTKTSVRKCGRVRKRKNRVSSAENAEV